METNIIDEIKSILNNINYTDDYEKQKIANEIFCLIVKRYSHNDNMLLIDMANFIDNNIKK